MSRKYANPLETMKKEIRTKLKNRAIALAKETENKKVDSSEIHVIVFTLASELYAIESQFVRELCQMKDFTPIPGVPDYILGLINVRGQILPVVNLKVFLNLPDKGLGELNKVIILNNDLMEFGILADVVHGTRTIETELIQKVPPTVTGIGEEYLRGVTTDSLIILNGDRLLSDNKIIVDYKVN